MLKQQSPTDNTQRTTVVNIWCNRSKVCFRQPTLSRTIISKFFLWYLKNALGHMQNELFISCKHRLNGQFWLLPLLYKFDTVNRRQYINYPTCKQRPENFGQRLASLWHATCTKHLKLHWSDGSMGFKKNFNVTLYVYKIPLYCRELREISIGHSFT